MSNLLFFHRSGAYRHAARMELQQARTLPPGPERDQAVKRARALRDLARNQAWLEGHTPQMYRHRQRPAVAADRGGVGLSRAASASSLRSGG